MIKEKSVKWYKVILLFLIMYFSANSFVLVVKYAEKTVSITFFVVALTTLVSLLKGRYRIRSNTFIVVLICLVNILLTTVANGYMNAYMLLIMDFILALSVIRIFSRQDFVESYIFIMKVLSLFAIVIGLLNTIAPTALSMLKLYGGGDFNVYKDAVLSFQMVGVNRINSIWGEPGMFAVFLIFALIFEGFYVDRPISTLNYTVFVVAIFLTFSTTGIICLLIVLFAMMLDQRRNENSNRIILITMLLSCLFLFVVSNVPWINDLYTQSMGKLSSENISFAGRVAPVLYNIEEGFKHFLWGKGLQGGRFFVDYSFYSGWLVCNTSTTTFIFASFGIAYCFVTVYLMWKLAQSCRGRNRIIGLLLFVAMLLNINTQAIHLDQVYYLILFSVFMEDDMYCDICEVDLMRRDSL